MQQEDMETGDEQEPENIDGIYQIKNGGELKWFADWVNGELEGYKQNLRARAVLNNDVSISEYYWTLIVELHIGIPSLLQINFS